MIYSDSCGKRELYSHLYDNSLIGSEGDTSWDRHPQPPSPPPSLPLLQAKFSGPAPPPFGSDSHVYEWYQRHFEMDLDRAARSSTSHADSAVNSTNGSSEMGSTVGTSDAFAPANTPMSSTQLLFHSLNHLHIVLSALSCYLAEDTLMRDLMNSNRELSGTPQQHQHFAQGVLNARSHAVQCDQALASCPDIESLREKACFRTFEFAKERFYPLLDPVKAAYEGGTIPTTSEIKTMKGGWGECMALQTGTQQQEGWMHCWNIVT